MKQWLRALRNSLDRAGEHISDDALIRFDHRVFILVFIVILMFALAVLFQIHGSSINSWDQFQPGRQEDTGIILGSPEPIRSDEWMVSTTWALSQAKHGFPLSNTSVGANNDPLLTNIPVRHISTIFRPQDWGYFTLDVSRGFSFMWNFKIFGVLLGFFFLLMILTGNHFWLSVIGSVWILFSGFTQWWFSTPLPETISSLALAFTGLAYVLVARKKVLIIGGASLLTVFAINFVLFFYPPYQVPLAWLGIFLAVGLLMTGGRWRLFTSRLPMRLPIIGGCGLVMLAVLFFFYQDAKDTIAAISNTDYPGVRLIEGGETGLAKMFSGFTDVPYSMKRFPPVWGNACEASSYILLFPVIFIGWARNYTLKIRNNRLVSVLLIYLLIISAWLLVKFPHLLAKITLLNYVQSQRAQLGLGLASILVTIIFLAGKDAKPMDRAFARGATAFIFVLLILYGFLFDQVTGDWLKYPYVLIMAVFFTIISYLILMKRKLAFSILILLALAPYYPVNPIAYGLDPIYGNRVMAAAQAIQAQVPDLKWVEYGGNTLANFLKPSGMNIIDGNQYTPNLDFYRALDPEREYQFIYNRYSDVVFGEPKEGSGKEVDFVLIQADSFAVLIDPCSSKLKDLGIDGFAFTYQPEAEKVSCLEPVYSDEESHVWMFERKKS